MKKPITSQDWVLGHVNIQVKMTGYDIQKQQQQQQQQQIQQQERATQGAFN
jgi:hypothetical protein